MGQSLSFLPHHTEILLQNKIRNLRHKTVLRSSENAKFISRPEKINQGLLFCYHLSWDSMCPLDFVHKITLPAFVVCWRHSNYDVCTENYLFALILVVFLVCFHLSAVQENDGTATVRKNTIIRAIPTRLDGSLSHSLRNTDKQTNPENKLKMIEISHVFFRTPCSVCQWHFPWRDISNSQLGPNEWKSPDRVKK